MLSDDQTPAHAAPDELQIDLPAILDLIGEGAWSWDVTSGRVIHNAVWSRIFGIDDGALEHCMETAIARIHPEDRARLQLRIEESRDLPDRFEDTYRVSHADGSETWVSSRGVVVDRNPDGTARRVTGSVRDITARVQATQALESSEGRFADLAENVPGAIFEYTLHPDGSDAVKYISRGCEDIWEMPAKDIRGDLAQLWRMVDPEDLPAMRDSVFKSAETGEHWAWRWRITTPSGRRKWLHGTGRPTRRADGTVSWNSLILDVTEQVRIEQDLRESQELLHQAQKMDALGKLTGGVAHDFNNLLSVVVGNLELLREDPDAVDRDDLIDQGIAAAFRGSALTRQLLAYSRRAQLEPAVIDPVAAFSELETMISRVLPSNIQITCGCAKDVPSIRVDRTQLETALLNLAVNARDAMQDGGTIAVEIQRVLVDEKTIPGESEDMAPGPYAVVTVSDTGSGMSGHDIGHAFDPFYTTKPVGMGSGLGLSAVLGFTRQSGGTTALRSELGRGTSVSMYFPAARTGPPDVPATDTAGPENPTLHILLVEDEIDVLKMLERQLRSEGHTVTTATTGDKALALIEGGLMPDLLLTDIVMPGELQGPVLAQRVRDRRPGIRILFISGYPKDNSGTAFDALPDVVILPKPVPKADLLKAIANTVPVASG